MTLQQLESHLWGAANILRGKIDSSDYKHYIFGLLFYKRICDVWEEEYEDRMAELLMMNWPEILMSTDLIFRMVISGRIFENNQPILGNI
jgi:type I restriction-modification system DNA methylase subunit